MTALKQQDFDDICDFPEQSQSSAGFPYNERSAEAEVDGDTKRMARRAPMKKEESFRHGTTASAISSAIPHLLLLEAKSLKGMYYHVLITSCNSWNFLAQYAIPRLSLSPSLFTNSAETSLT